MGAGADLGGAQDHGVAAGQGRGDSAGAENNRRVPRRDAEHDARRLTDRHRENTRLVRWDYLAGDLVVSDAASRRMPAARCTLKPAQGAVAPVSSSISLMKSLVRL